MNESDGDGSTEADPSSPVDVLLGDDRAVVDELLAGETAGPLAVCSPPFGGRERVLEYVAAELDTELVTLAPGTAAEIVTDALGDGPLVVDGCQHLYERRVGGFERLDAVLRALAGADGPVVLGWNRYAWAYLARVRGLERAVGARAEVGPVAAEALAGLLLKQYDDVPEFSLDDETESEGLVSVRRYGVSVRGRDVSIPVPVPNVGPFRAEAGEEPDALDVAFERLASVSGGNLGVATALWEADTGESRRPSDIVAAGTDLTLDREAAFCLRILLVKEQVERAELDRVLDEPERLVGRLVRDGLARREGTTVALEPAAVPTAVTETERRRFQ